MAQYAQDVGSTGKTISKKYVSLNSNTGYVYGNDDSVYINVELKNVVVDDNSNGGLLARSSTTWSPSPPA